MDQLKQGSVPRGHVLGAAVVCSVLVASALATGWFIREALEERQVTTAATNVRLAAQTVASAHVGLAVGVETSPPGLPAAIELLEGDHELALHSLDEREQREAERFLSELVAFATLLSHESGHTAHEYDGLEVLLSTAALRADTKAALAERRAMASLLVAAVAAGAAGSFLLRSRTSEMRLRRELLRQANTDLLTGLPNRRALDSVLRTARLRMESAGCATAVIILDLDGFKDINDTLGHSAGDALLAQVADRLRGAQLGDDVLLRLGGDEFAVVLPGLGDPAGAEQAAYRYLQILNDPFKVGSRREHLRTSIGVSISNDHTLVANLTTEADMAMYEAKRSGGNAVAVFDRSMEIHSNETSRVTRALRAAEYDKEFGIVYQPIVTIDGGTTVGYEALLRWISPTLGAVSPDDFIPVAERSGEICEIGRWVIASVCRQLQSWDEIGQPDRVTISCNISPYQLMQEDFVDYVLSTLDACNVSRHRLVVEVTESAILDHTGAAVQRLAQLRQAGLQVSIDDFGSGYSNLGQLLQVPFDIIKIDRSLLLRLTTMRERAGGDRAGPCAIMVAIVSIASVFNAPVVCEGVETEDQRRSLEASGITHVQGYLIGRPTPAAELAPLAEPSLMTT